MKDLLSEVLLRKRYCLEQCGTVSEVVKVFEPLLKVVSKAKKQTCIETLANALSVLIMEAANDIEATGVLEAADIGEVQTDTGSSGALDQVGDDCLRHCLEYVSAKDRIDNVELSCRRLFHLSRREPYNDLISLSEAIRQFAVPQSRVVDFARRTRCSSVYLNRPPLKGMDVATVCQCVSVLRLRIDRLMIPPKFASITRFLFPKLILVNSLRTDAQSALPFIKRHCYLRAAFSELPLTLETLEVLCGRNAVDDISNLSIDGRVLDAAQRRGLDLRKFAYVSFKQCNDFAAVKPFLHSETKAFTCRKYTDARNCATETRLPNLRALILAIDNPSVVSLRNLNLKTSAKMRIVKCSASLLDLYECLRLCPFGEVHFTAEMDACTVLEATELFNRLLIGCNQSTFNQKSVTLTLNGPEFDSGWLIARDFVQFLVVCDNILPTERMTLRMSSNTYSKLRQALGRAMMAKLKSTVQCIVIR